MLLKQSPGSFFLHFAVGAWGRCKDVLSSRLLLVMGGVLGLTLAYFSLASDDSHLQAQVNPQNNANQVGAVQPVNYSAGLPNFADVVERISPSVVNIRTSAKVTVGGAGANPFGFGEDDPFSELFRQFGFPFPAPRGGAPSSPPREESRPRGVGSGFVISNDGYILTNAHVIDKADEVIVTLTDKREFKAKVVGADERTDVAVVKIEAQNLPPALRVGNVERLRVGEWVLAIGSPFGLENTVTAGIVSAKQRDTGDYLPFIQSDVAINPGNSGGPLINIQGEVVGINSQIYSRSGGSVGISFSIPIDEALRISEQLRATGKVERGRLGVSIDSVSKEVANSIGLGKDQGALVRSVEPGSPADRAGLRPGDVITQVNGQTINRSSELPRLIGAMRPGTQARLSVHRLGRSQTINVTMGAVEESRSASASSASPSPSSSAAANALGLQVAELTESERKSNARSAGVKVQSVTGAAQRAGIRAGDIVLSLANVEVKNMRDFELALQRAKGAKAVSALVLRGDAAQFLVLNP